MGSQPSTSNEVQIPDNSTEHEQEQTLMRKENPSIVHAVGHISEEERQLSNKDMLKENQHMSHDSNDRSEEDRHISNDKNKDTSKENHPISNDANEDSSKEDHHISKNPNEHISREDRNISNDANEDISKEDRNISNDANEDISKKDRNISNDANEDISKEDRHIPNNTNDDMSEEYGHEYNDTNIGMFEEDIHIYNDTNKDVLKEEHQICFDINKDTSWGDTHISNGTKTDMSKEDCHKLNDTNEGILKEDVHVSKNRNENMSNEHRLSKNTNKDLSKKNSQVYNDIKEETSNENYSNDNNKDLSKKDSQVYNDIKEETSSENHSDTNKDPSKNDRYTDTNKDPSKNDRYTDTNKDNMSKEERNISNDTKENKFDIEKFNVSNLNWRSIKREPVVATTKPIIRNRIFKTRYTIKEISLHNRGKRQIDIFPFKDNVYSTSKFKKAIRRVVELKYKEFKQENKKVEPYDYKDFNKKWKCSPIYLVMFKYKKMYIRFADIKPELPSCKVAEVSKEDGMYKDIINDSKTILQKLKKESKLAEYKRQYEELLEICELASSDPKSFFESNIPKGKDPNAIEFPLPEQIKADRKVLRKWIPKWKPFITDISEGGAWAELPDNVVNAMSDPLDLKDICRVTYDDLPGFDFTVKEEVVWNVIERDIVKYDKTLAEQERNWRSRDKRKNLNDTIVLFCKGIKLEKYFLDKYDWNISKLLPYRGFTARLQKGWDEFQSLFLVEM